LVAFHQRGRAEAKRKFENIEVVKQMKNDFIKTSFFPKIKSLFEADKSMGTLVYCTKTFDIIEES